LLDKFFVASKQLDDLHSTLTPLFALTIPLPRKLPLPPTEPFNVPQLLSTSMPPEDVDKIRIPPQSVVGGAEAKEAMARHNASIEGCVAKFNAQVDSWKRGGKRPREG